MNITNRVQSISDGQIRSYVVNSFFVNRLRHSFHASSFGCAAGWCFYVQRNRNEPRNRNRQTQPSLVLLPSVLCLLSFSLYICRVPSTNTPFFAKQTQSVVSLPALSLSKGSNLFQKCSNECNLCLHKGL